MFYSRKLNHCISSIHERKLSVTDRDYKSTFELLQKDNSVTIHQLNLKVLAIEIFCAKNDLLPKTMKQNELKEPSYILHPHGNYFTGVNVKTIQHVIQSI